MIRLNRLNGALFVLNAELIETVESTPDTLISLTDGKKFVVLDSLPDVIEKVVAYRQGVRQGGTPVRPADPAENLAASPRARFDED